MADHKLDRNRDHIVDGYNLLHALGLVRRSMPRKAFEVAREAFLTDLGRAWSGPGHLLVCLDGHVNPAISSIHGGQVRSRNFETRYSNSQTADDLILELVAAAGTPANLVIVSGDNGITVEARSRGCAIAGCVEWYASLTESGGEASANRVVEVPEKPESPLPGSRELEKLWAPDVERQQEEARGGARPAKAAKPRPHPKDDFGAMLREASEMAHAAPPEPVPAKAPPSRPAVPRPSPDPLEAMKQQAREILEQTARQATAPRPDTPRPLRGAVAPGRPVDDIGGMGVPDSLIAECRKIIDEEGSSPSRGGSGGL
ncbi:MAG: NYN domain-containing protein [Planctomycetota bacterium]